MRPILLVLILLVVVAIGAIATGFLNINQVRPAQVPDVDANGSGVVASGGQAPKFDVETGKIAVGTQERTVKLPAIEVRPADGGQARGGSAQPGQQQPQPQPQQQQPQPPPGVTSTNATQP